MTEQDYLPIVTAQREEWSNVLDFKGDLVVVDKKWISISCALWVGIMTVGATKPVFAKPVNVTEQEVNHSTPVSGNDPTKPALVQMPVTPEELAIFRQYSGELSKYGDIADLDTRISQLSPEVRDIIKRAADFLGMSELVRSCYYVDHKAAMDVKIKNINDLIKQSIQNNPNQTLNVNEIILKEYPLPAEGRAIMERIQSLDFTGFGITALSPNAFQDFSSLNKLYLAKNKLSSLPENVFHELTNLTSIYLSENQLNILPESVFHGLTKLETLQLYQNKLSSLPENVFHGLTKINYLNVAGSQLSSLPENVFQGLTSLQLLFLAKNQLKALPENVFRGLPKLELIFLQENKLSSDSIPKTTFANLMMLRTLRLEDNYLRENERQFRATHILTPSAFLTMHIPTWEELSSGQY